ncbi:MAG: SMC-Scp complex subunit ScpB [Erysipelotrichaceae bacterium]|jgi:segregation and condensation protein B|nr:SMC-Scp complex subunit ScpB [Erysipelotrichaceae bacterium]
MPDLSALLEGLLFLVGEEGLALTQIAQLLDITVIEAQQLLEDLIASYQQGSHGVEIVGYGDRYKFVSKAFIHPLAQKLFDLDRQRALSHSALETLAIIAYKQPITRAEIEEIRGVSCDVMLRKLMARGLVEERTRSKAAGRPILYGVTEEFLDVFKLASLTDLPQLPDYHDNSDNEDLYERSL